MKTFKRICIADHTIVDGVDKFEIKRGREYITSPEHEGKVIVYSTYWATSPANIFAGAIPGPGDSHCE